MFSPTLPQAATEVSGSREERVGADTRGAEEINGGEVGGGGRGWVGERHNSVVEFIKEAGTLID